MTFAQTSANATNNKKGRIVIRFLFCLFIAFILWLFNTLANQHQDTIFVNLRYELAENKISQNKLPAQAELQVVSTGWQLLKEQFRVRSLSIDLAAYSENAQLLTNLHKNLFSADLPEDIVVNHIFPDTLNMQIENKLSATIPVKMRFKGIVENHWEIDSLYFYPDSITVTGPESIVQQFTYWPTESITIFDLDSNLRGVAILSDESQVNLTLSAAVVAYGIRVFKYTNQTYTFLLPNPMYKDRTVTVKLLCQVPSMKTAETSEQDFKINLLPLGPKGMYAVKCEQFPDWVQNITVQPTFISVTSKE